MQQLCPATLVGTRCARQHFIICTPLEKQENTQHKKKQRREENMTPDIIIIIIIIISVLGQHGYSKINK